ncbi:MAG: DUF4177 domain-containing protein [Clostridiales bacterium]|nr:DUF4177 domain-containing protein [Clostridiales bacterium]
MYEYKSEVWNASAKLLSDKPNEKDLAELDKLINEWAKDGWELVSNSFFVPTVSKSGASLLTFRRKKD